MTSKLTRERIELIANFHRAMTLPPSHAEIEELARIALAAMDSSESVELPLDYLQGHKDGLEWAAQLAEANHPETGDWLYDDPIELAKAIRKGPDMPPVQPAPVVPDDGLIAELLAIAKEAADDADAIAYAEFSDKSMQHTTAISDWERRAVMLAATKHDTHALNSVQSVVTVPDKWMPVSEQMPENKPGSCEYLVFETLNNRVNHDYWNAPDKGDDAFTPFWNYYGEHVTHWMPLPAAPQEVKGE